MIDSKEKKECCGCSGCAQACPQNAITMVEDNKGFLYPKIDKQICISCGICDNVCAFFNSQLHRNHPQIYGVKHKDEQVRKKSTSGGAFTAISDYVLDNNGVIYGAKYDSKLNVIHTRATNVEERNLCRGSKYVQSDLRGIYIQIKEDLDGGKMVLFTGTPCQVSGLYGFLKKTYINLITVDVLCHGTPSPKLWREFINLYEHKAHSKIDYADFRDKSNGWSKSYIFKFIYADKKKNIWGENSFNQLFLGNYSLRDSCYNCKFRSYNRPSDITLADFWGIDKADPKFFDESGISLVMINSEKGDEIFGKISMNIDYVKRYEEDLRQDQITGKVTKNIHTDDFWQTYFEKGFKFALKKYTDYSYPKTICRKIKNRIKRYLRLGR